jgi:hypothetical protein
LTEPAQTKTNPTYPMLACIIPTRPLLPCAPNDLSCAG